MAWMPWKLRVDLTMQTGMIRTAIVLNEMRHLTDEDKRICRLAHRPPGHQSES